MLGSGVGPTPGTSVGDMYAPGSAAICSLADAAQHSHLWLEPCTALMQQQQTRCTQLIDMVAQLKGELLASHHAANTCRDWANACESYTWKAECTNEVLCQDDVLKM